MYGQYPPQDVPQGSHSCKRVKTPSFPEFKFKDISKFQLTKTEGNIQTWEYKKGARHHGEGSSREKIKLQKLSNQVIILYYETYGSGWRWSTTKTRTTTIYVPVKQPQGYFQVPGFCPSR